MKPSVEILIEKYRSNLYSIAFNVCKNAQDAEAVVQDTFILYWMYPALNIFNAGPARLKYFYTVPLVD